jgi:hypothetical protein
MGQSLWECMLEPSKTHTLEHFGCPSFSICRCHTPDSQSKSSVFQGTLPREKTISGQHVCHLRTAKLGTRITNTKLLSSRQVHQPSTQIKQRCFAAPTGARQGHELTFPHAQIDVLKHAIHTIEA